MKSPSASPSAVRLAWLACVMAIAASIELTAATSAAEEIKVEGKTVELPEFAVTDSRVLPDAPTWLHGRVGRFEVLSSAGRRTTSKLMADLGRFQAALALLWPAPPKPIASSTILLCARRGEFDAFIPADSAPDAPPPSRMLRNRESLALVVNLTAERISVNDGDSIALTGANTVELELDHATLLYREYVFSLLNQTEARPPAWMAEGLAQIVMDAEITDRWLVYGKIDTEKGSAVGGGAATEDTDASANGTAVVGEQPFNTVLRYQKLLPLGKFFAITGNSPEARTPLGNNLWAKQAYMFVHYCLFGENLQHRDALVKFVGRLGREPLSEELFRDCFKVGYADMEQNLRAYLRHLRHKYQTYDLKPGERFDAQSIVLADASPAQIGTILGDAHRLTGNLERAGQTYRDAYLRGARTPALLAGLATTEATAGPTERSQKFLSAACAAHVERPSAHAELARQRLSTALAHPAAPGGKIDAAQLASVLSVAFEARKYPPLIPETYDVIADAWAASAIPPKPQNLAVLDEGLKSFPRESALVLKAAQLYASIGAHDTAASAARMGARFATEAEARVRFERLLASLPAPAAK